MKNLFLKIIKKEIKSNILFENKRVIAFYDTNPKTKGHFLVVPKTYSRNLITIKEQDLRYCFSIARKLAKKEMIKQKADGFKLVVNNEPSSNQVVFHTHIHIIPSTKLPN
ncbi:MAG: HIT family protein [Mycoplasmataceae bacterium]|nr:HIT family protein [Mycoplasmataceae bacterium]